MRLLFAAAIAVMSLSVYGQSKPNAVSSSANQAIGAFNAKVRVISRKDKDTYSEFNDILSTLQETLFSEKDPRRRYIVFATAANELYDLKMNGKRPEDERQAMEMAFVMETFEEMPPMRRYKPENCMREFEEARLRMMDRPEPGDGMAEDVGVHKGLQVLALVCGG